MKIKVLGILTALVAGNCLAAVAQPGQVQLAWDSSPTPGVSYRLYAYTNSFTVTNLASAPVRLDAKTNLTATVQLTNPGTWRFVATAYLGPLESVPSNELMVTLPTPPPNLRTVVVQFNATVSGTNWLDTGFFRIKFGD